MTQALALHLPTTQPAPAAPTPRVWSPVASPAPVAWGSDAFVASAPVAATWSLQARAGQTLDELEGNDPIAGGRLPVRYDEPIGSGGAIVLRGGSRGAYVTRLQERLTAAGHDVGAVDGAFGARTERAVKDFQRAHGLRADGIVGADTWNALGEGAQIAIRNPGNTSPEPTGDVGRLMGSLRNRYYQRRHQCFRYAWTTVVAAGGKPYGRAEELRTGRGQGTAHLGAMAARGELQAGDVIYVNRRPGADPSSTNLRYGPHWMVYLGRGQFADQYGVRDAQAMANFVPGRKIDLIFRTM